jgi:ABC-type polysaccharide/polyol phosphate export permease
MTNPTLGLLRQIVLRDLRLRYRSTFLGFFWSLAKPGAMILLFYIVFQKILDMRAAAFSDYTAEASYGVFVAIGIITWTFISGATIEGISAYLTHSHLITKASFYRPVLPLGCVVSHWIHYLFAQAVLVLFLGFIGYHHWESNLLVLIPLNLVELALVGSLVTLLAWFQVRTRDTLQFTELGLMVWFYGSPIIYTASIAVKSNFLNDHFSEKASALIYLANPLAPLLVLRQRLLTSAYLAEPEMLRPTPAQLHDALMIAVLLIGALAYLAYRINRRVNEQIADKI